MRYLEPVLLLVFLSPPACSTSGGTPRDPGNPRPVADPRSGPATVGGERPGGPSIQPTGRGEVPVRADQAPLVGVREALEADTLLGRRVRVSGRCTARGEGRRAGSWTLDQNGASIEVRGLVPASCPPRETEDLTIFAQIEPKSSGSRDRILLRLPD